ncbi:flagellar hook protein FlgE [Thiorhodospira sibirica]|uniref:flagellar hook protein FlgE n=1 Tax=Thiorhodospira sibirica TaxID=154347 RepID=UPI00022C527B|nr:flagellar hook protein FlgE [Thiorhodospira sibirica]
MPFNIGLTGLNASSADLRVTGHNIANSSTAGFKASRAEFADVFASQCGSTKSIGSGVRLAATAQQFKQGNIEFTGNALDMAINGKGFFVMDSGNGVTYTRAGQFQVNREGDIVNAQGLRLQGYPYQGVGPNGEQFNTGAFSNIRLDTSPSDPGATTNIMTHLNLPANAQPPEIDWEDPDPTAEPPVGIDPNSYNHSTSTTIYDSLGQSHTATLYFVKGEDELAWTVHTVVNGEKVSENELTFNASGTFDDPTAAIFEDIEFTPENGAEAITFNLDFSNTTQWGEKFKVVDAKQDGFTTGQLSGIEIDGKGVVFARFTNGESRPLGMVAMATFENPQGLKQIGDNQWEATFASGDPVYGVAQNGKFGDIVSGGFEASNVDLAEQLVHLIVAQRNFQANAQVIQAADTVTQTIINIR